MTCRLRLRHVVLVAVCTGLGLGAAAAPGAARQAAPVLADLGVREPAAQEAFFNSLIGGFYPDIPGGKKAFAAASPDQRAAIVRGLGAFVKAYTRTDAFRRRYAAAREAAQPRAAASQTKTLEDHDREADAMLAKMEASLESLPPDMRKEMEKVVQELREQQAALRKDAEVRSRMTEALKHQETAEAQRREKALRDHQTRYPENPDALVARRLQAFLELSGTVDFSARVVKDGVHLRFANPEYEAKPAVWKLSYRAGKDATEAAQAFAAEWLSELGR